MISNRPLKFPDMFTHQLNSYVLREVTTTEACVQKPDFLAIAGDSDVKRRCPKSIYHR